MHSLRCKGVQQEVQQQRLADPRKPKANRMNKTTCWWRKQYGILGLTDGLARLPGKILLPEKYKGTCRNSRVFVKPGYSSTRPLTLKEAHDWVDDGKLPDWMENSSGREKAKDFLSTA
eukprot:TRINITY_DN22091_c0_g1_i1.p1 TRINITY_DN22091_c0_g1~~TRINITY_DN22091_c0_g1_i1.p1  ORF type:complete len:118 (+),score=11.10 TRINITY_DN22091_c0_g1_i1:83-436(+)